MATAVSTTSIAARFLAHPAPRAELAVLLAAVGARAYTAAMGSPLTRADAAIAGVTAAALPFVEWAVHFRLLHAKPIQWRGHTIATAAARAHAAHHADPRNERLIVTPPAALLPLLPVLALAAILPSWALRATAVAVLAAAVLSTEWVHYLVHAQTAPRSGWLRRRAMAHRLHHYRNDRYWFGLTSGIADALMRTAPGRDASPVRRRPAPAVPSMTVRPAGAPQD